MIRLTLRTLLAYLDELSELTDEQRADLKQQIEQSDYARELIHRITDASRRARLPAPDVLGSGIADDPNTVAEYLENALPPDSVTEFERVCLESDTMLAEVSACHAVLDSLLADPTATELNAADLEHLEAKVLAGVEAEDRKAAEPIDEPAIPEPAMPAAGLNGAAEEAAEERRVRKAAVSEISEPTWGDRLPLIVGAVALMVVGALAVLFLAPTEDLVAKNDPPAKDAVRGTDPGAEDEPGPVEGAGEGGGEGADTKAGEDAATQNAAPPTEATTEPTPEARLSPPAPALPTVAERAAEAPQPPVEPEAEAAAAPSASEAATLPAAGAEPPATADEPAAQSEAQSEAQPLEVIATFNGPQTAVALSDEQGVWARLTEASPMPAGSTVQCLPEFRALFQLPDGATLKLVDDTRVTLEAGRDDPTAPRVVIRHGQVVLKGNGETPTSLEIETVGVVARVELNPSALLALDVSRPFEPGRDVEAGSPRLVVAGWSPDGGVAWDNGKVKVSPEEARAWVLGQTGGLDQLNRYSGDPGWIEPLGQLTRVQTAKDAVQQAIDPGVAAIGPLAELAADTDMTEVANLVVFSLATLGQYDGIVDSLEAEYLVVDDVERLLNALRGMVSRDEKQAAEVRAALTSKHGEQSSNQIMQMIRGFTTEQLGVSPEDRQQGAVAQMLEWLQEDGAPRTVLRLAAYHVNGVVDLTARRQIDPERGDVGKKARDLQRDLMGRKGLQFVGDPEED